MCPSGVCKEDVRPRGGEVSSELDGGEVEELRADLLALRETLMRTLKLTGELAGTVELDQAAVGRISRVDALQQQQMAAAQHRRSELRLKQVAVALSAFEEDEYGWCRKCGEPIGYRRLKARPESPCCVPCMREVEGGGASEGPSRCLTGRVEALPEGLR